MTNTSGSRPNNTQLSNSTPKAGSRSSTYWKAAALFSVRDGNGGNGGREPGMPIRYLFAGVGYALVMAVVLPYRLVRGIFNLFKSKEAPKAANENVKPEEKTHPAENVKLEEQKLVSGETGVLDLEKRKVELTAEQKRQIEARKVSRARPMSSVRERQLRNRRLSSPEFKYGS